MAKRFTHTPGPGLPTVELTTTQHSALGDLRRFGRLVAPFGNTPVNRGTVYGFGAVTLKALIAAGLAEQSKVPGDHAGGYCIRPVGDSDRIITQRARNARIAEATAYVQSRFYPPLPPEYGRLAVVALEEYAEYGDEGIVNLPDSLNPLPRGAYRDDDGDLAVPVLTLIDALRIGHLIHDFEDGEVE